MPPPRPRLALLVVPVGLAFALLVLVLPRAAAGAAPIRERWRWPVDSHTLAGRFAYSPRHPFATAQRRGIDIATPPGAAVRSACGGRVTFAGPVPGGRGLGVTVRCGALVATHLGLGRLAVRRGSRVAPGARIGTVGPAGRLRLGARVRAERFGYVDPVGLLGEERPPAAPIGRAPRGPRVPSPLRPAPRPRPVAVAARAGGAGVPAGAWAGLVVLAGGVPLGGLVRRSRRRRRILATAAAER
jgi:murein DD-endopeptidase MepM/ murein hydrolase activator NlpD